MMQQTAKTESINSDVAPVKQYNYKYSFETVQEALDFEKGGPRNSNKKYGIPTIDEVSCHLHSEDSFLKWLQEEYPDVLKHPETCPLCDGKLGFRRKDSLLRCLRCVQQGKKYRQSIWKNSFFEAGKQKHKIMLFLYHWLCGATTKQLLIYTGWSKTTVNKWQKKVQEMIAEMVIYNHEMIGGPGVVVEIDESKFGKRKYNRGHRVDGCWVFGGVELTHERRFFAVIVPDRSADTLIPIIKSHIAPGSIIRSDCWKAYDVLPLVEGYDYLHERVNHSKEFLSKDGVHTNTIEGNWSGLKRVVPVTKRTKRSLSGCLFEFIWRRRNEGNLWNGLMQALENIWFD